jgi:glycerol-3-phosphate acyltransferase PlsY
VLAIDILKGWAVTAILAPTSGAFPEAALSLRQVFFGVAAILGHTWSPWLKLKGGKGIAASAGALLGIFPLATLVGTLIWAVMFAVWRYVSLASMIAAACYPFLLLLFHRGIESFALVFVISIALAALLIYNHRANIERIKRGEEPRVPFGKTPTP